MISKDIFPLPRIEHSIGIDPAKSAELEDWIKSHPEETLIIDQHIIQSERWIRYFSNMLLLSDEFVDDLRTILEDVDKYRTATD